MRMRMRVRLRLRLRLRLRGATNKIPAYGNAIIETEAMQRCYSTIVNFFSAWGLQPAKKYLDKILRSAMDKKATKLNPSNYFKTLNGLIVG
jgi:hypothetical protein